ncbi:hypothetical protein B0F90DRAFT_25636 [Multifurca ochricompacta]|uniref:SAGA-associated factor 11 n=1 Tax=Multifurca ochricompacta TaxID=376703 RepID=A0AAD4MDD7_9AGAM|nr:hypothetical protein B0F90DRAFT_25636 [Multifurca ochricompacta]
MAKAERDDALNTLASRLFATMLDDIVVDVALKSHQEVSQSRRKCDVCHTHCRQVHVPTSVSTIMAATASQSTLPGSRQGTPPRDLGTPGATGTPTGSINKDGTALLECIGCGRPISSNRYAPHLSSCIGIGTGTRRAAARNATSKSKLGSDAGRSASPYPGSENGNVSDNNAPLPPPGPPKKKGRPPKNKPKASVQTMSVANDDSEPLSNRKRPGSPLSSPTKNTKKQKVSIARAGTVRRLACATIVSITCANSGQNTPLGLSGTKSQSKIPSRLRESSIASFLEPEATGASPGSRSSSPGTAATPTSSVLGNGRANGTIGGEEKRIPPRIPSPPRPPPPITRRPETDYLVDVEGDETGSSTDTDSE